VERKEGSKQARRNSLSFSPCLYTPFLKRGDGGGGGQCGIAKMAMIHRNILAKFGYKLKMKINFFIKKNVLLFLLATPTLNHVSKYGDNYYNVGSFWLLTMSPNKNSTLDLVVFIFNIAFWLYLYSQRKNTQPAAAALLLLLGGSGVWSRLFFLSARILPEKSPTPFA
jgi:hypothetical protein